MTTIAWDGTTLAADKGATAAGARATVTKIWKDHIDGREVLIAGCGAMSLVMAMRDFVTGRSEQKPNPADHGEPPQNLCLLIVNDRRRVQIVTCAGYRNFYEDSLFAFGGGQDFAWGALEAGATAIQAVEIAARRSDYSSMGVDAVTFE